MANVTFRSISTNYEILTEDLLIIFCIKLAHTSFKNYKKNIHINKIKEFK